MWQSTADDDDLGIEDVDVCGKADAQIAAGLPEDADRLGVTGVSRPLDCGGGDGAVLRGEACHKR
jgi:hypothetical protein